MRVVVPKLQKTFFQNRTEVRSSNDRQSTVHQSEPFTESKLATLLVHGALCIDAAIEYPLMLAYHPTTLLRNRNLANIVGIASIQSPWDRIASICLLLLAEALITAIVQQYRQIQASLETKEVNDFEDDDSAATDLALNFIIPRATLLVSVVVTGMGLWEMYFGTGGMDIGCLAWWVALRHSFGLWRNAKA
jgi:hypothetical protein